MLHWFAVVWRAWYAPTVQVRYIKSACVVIEHAGVRVLCDPWLTDGIFYGSWYHYPPLTVTPEDFAGVDYLYISHVHPDHLDVETLKRLPKSTRILIHDFEEKFVLRILQSLGFTSIREIAHGEEVTLDGGLQMEILAADGCNPILCGKFFGCSAAQPGSRTKQIDTLAVFSAGGNVVVNTNDCPYELARNVCKGILERHGHVDLLLVGYSGAGPFPQCFDMPDAEKRTHADAKRDQFLQQAMRYIRRLRPLSFLPFAGQYTLGGSLTALNPFRGVPELEELPGLLLPMLQEREIDTRMILLNSKESINVEDGSVSAPFTPPDPVERQRYINDVLSKKLYLYQDQYRIDDRDRTDLTPVLQDAQRRMWKHQESFGYLSPTILYIDAGQEFLYRVPFDGKSPVETAPRGSEKPPFVRIGLEYSLLSMILQRKAHWNNAEIGSHLRYHREPDTFERGFYHMMSYLHA